MSKWCLGIDLGGTFIKFTLLNQKKQATEVIEIPTPFDKGADGVVKQMLDGAKKIMKIHNIDEKDVLGVGVGAPGPLSITEGKIISLVNIKGMEDVPLRNCIAEGLGLPAILENDANAAAYGEFLCGAGKGYKSMVMLTLGTGVGSGIIINGNILHGSHEIGSELGHMIVEQNGEQCNCGQKGCLERYASAKFVAHLATKMITEDKKESSLKSILDSGKLITAKDVDKARQSGDKLASEVWDKGVFYLAIACVNICRIFDPDIIVLGGGMTRSGEALMKPLVKYFKSMHWKLTDVKTELSIGLLGSGSGAIGAAGVAWRTFGETV